MTMHTPDPHAENAVVDGDEMTTEEARLSALPLDVTPESEAAEAAEAARVAQEAKDAETAAAAEAAAAATAAETAAREQAERDAAARAAADGTGAPAQGAPQALGEKPEAPKDFATAYAEIDTQYDDGDLTRAQHAAKVREIMQEEFNHQRAVEDWTRADALQKERQETAAANFQNDWNAAASAWESANAEFMGVLSYRAQMQRSIELVMQDAANRGQALTPAAILDAAQKDAFTVVGYTGKPATTTPDGGEPTPEQAAAERAALAKRNGGQIPPTIANVPSAGTPEIKGNESFAQLDNLGIEQLEEAVQHMTPAQVEAFLADAPGAKTHGRGDDPTDT